MNEFKPLLNGGFPPAAKYLQLADDAWVTYDAQADEVVGFGHGHSTRAWFDRVINETYGQARLLGFSGPVDQWAKEVKDAGVRKMQREPRSTRGESRTTH